jgi:hypothetical protein
MSNLHNERYDEIKSLLKKSKLLFEQDGQINVAKDVESRIQQDVEYDTAETEVEAGEEPTPKDKSQKYRISGGILKLHGKENSGIYINGEMIKVDEEFLTLINKLQQFYQKFKSKWGKVLANRKKTSESPV